jgi:hypothetical protein
MKNSTWIVNIIESERGWGSRIDEIKEFDDYQSAAAFQKEFNKYNNKSIVPDWYMYAADPEEVSQVSKSIVCFNEYGKAIATYCVENDKIRLILFDGIGSSWLFRSITDIHKFMKHNIHEETEGYVVRRCGAYWRTEDGKFRVKTFNEETDLFDSLLRVRKFFIDKLNGFAV